MVLLLKAKPVIEKIYATIEQALKKIDTQARYIPTLATVLVGSDPASQLYVSSKGSRCKKLGIKHKDYKLPQDTTQAEVLQLLQTLNQDKTIDGILVQRPLPSQLNAGQVFDILSPEKDVDCFSPYNTGLLVQNRAVLKPCTPAGILSLLEFYKIEVAGKNALVIGRSEIVGKPTGLLLLHANATVTFAHSKTKNLPALIQGSDLVISAIGKPCFLKQNLPWKKEAVVVDVGVNRLEDLRPEQAQPEHSQDGNATMHHVQATSGDANPTQSKSNKLYGDVDFENVKNLVSAITPVPGGVGPMTIAMLMLNTIKAAFLRKNLSL